MFIAALLTMATIWKQPECLLPDEWIKKMWYKCTMEYYSAIKNEIMPSAATWMGPDIIILNGVSQKEKDKYGITYMWNLKHNTNKHIYETETVSRTDNRLMVAKGKGVGGRME